MSGFHRGCVKTLLKRVPNRPQTCQNRFIAIDGGRAVP